MKRTPLDEYLEDENNTQKHLAASVGLTQGAIGKMLRAKRTITVVEHDSGAVELFEEKTIGSAAGIQESQAA